MSVINDMLRDLDKRKAPEVGGSQTIPQESLIGPQASAYPKIIFMVFILLFLALLTYFFIAGKKPDTSVLPLSVEDVVLDSKHSAMRPLTEQSVSEEEIQTLNKKQKNEPQKTHKQKAESQENKPEKVTRDVAQVITKKQTISPLQEVSKIDSKRPQKTTEGNVEAAVIETKAEEALKVKESVATQEPKNIGVKLSPVALDQQMAEKALSLMSQYKEAEAYRELYAFIGEHDEDMESRTVLATYLLKENRMAEVGDILLNAPINKSPKLRQIKARWYAQQGKHNLALYTLSSDLPDVATYPEYYVLLAAYYQRYGTAKEAKAAYSTLVDYNETVADWWAGLGLAADRNNEKEKAYYAYQQALELPGLSPELLKFVRPRLIELQVIK
jgi:tetratricopeptide (TPR) repeat protein